MLAGARLWIRVFLLIVILVMFSSGDDSVPASLYSKAHLPCAFAFIRGTKHLIVVWEKVETDGKKRLLHKFMADRDDLSEQDPHYNGRTDLSRDLSQGNLGLTLTNVTFSDEGTYYCRAANDRDHRDKKVELSISGLEATEPTVTVIHDGGSRHLKCSGRGLFREPRVLWYDQDKAELSSQATLHVRDLANGMKMVESVLHNVEKNEQYICDIEEGKFHRKVRAVISDGSSSVHVGGP